MFGGNLAQNAHTSPSNENSGRVAAKMTTRMHNTHILCQQQLVDLDVTSRRQFVNTFGLNKEHAWFDAYLLRHHPHEREMPNNKWCGRLGRVFDTAWSSFLSYGILQSSNDDDDIIIMNDLIWLIWFWSCRGLIGIVRLAEMSLLFNCQQVQCSLLLPYPS